MNLQRQQSATLAAEEINAVGGIPTPPSGGKRQKLVMLSCNEVDPAGTPAGTVLRRAGAHLINDLHVPAIVGPNTSQDTIELSNAVSAAQGGTLILTPTAVAAQIADLMDNDLTWLMVPSDQQRGPLMINQINQLETELKAARGKSIMKLGIVYRDDAVGLGTLRSLNGLIFNGQPLNAAINTGSGGNVSIDGYQVSGATNQDAIVNKYVNFAPDIIVLAGLAEVITTVMNPIEQRWSDAGSARAWYVLTDQVKGPDLRTSTTNMPNLRTRVRGTGLTPGQDSISVQTAFELSYNAKYGKNPDASGAGPSYDSTYAIAYALAGTRDLPVSGEAISKGLRKLAGGMTIPVGSGSPLLTAFGKLAAGENINAIGTYLPMEWDDKGAVVNGTIEIWCVGLPGGSTTPAYGSSGLTYDIAAKTTMGAYVQCSP
jgi:ABC-type branched-subunit amino acid transport system substrate-binding protein